MKTKESTYKPNVKLIATGFFASTTCWLVVDNFIVPVSIGSYVLIEIAMGVCGAFYAFEKKRLQKDTDLKTETSKEKLD